MKYKEAVTEWSHLSTARSVRWVTSSGAVPSMRVWNSSSRLCTWSSGLAPAWWLSIWAERRAGSRLCVFSVAALSFLSGFE